MTVRYYSSVAQPTTLALNLTGASTVMEVTAAVGYPSSFPFTVCVDFDTALRELVTVTNAAGTTWTVTRGSDGTSSIAHSAGATVRHVSSARDYADSRSHENAAMGVHGISGDVVGDTDVQTLTNKTLTAPTINGGTSNNQTLNSPIFSGTIAGATLSNPTITGTVAGAATYTNPTLTTPTLTTPAATNGTFATPTITTPTINTGGSWSGSPTVTTPTVVNPTVTTSGAAAIPLVVQPNAAQSVDIVQIYDKNGLKKNYIDSGGTLNVVGSATDVALTVTNNTGVANTDSTVIFRDNTSTTRAKIKGNGQFESDVADNVFMLFLNRPGSVASDAVSYQRASVPMAGITDDGQLYAQNFGSAAWATYPVAWSSTGTQPALGNGTLSAKYARVGRLITVKIHLVIGSTTTTGTGSWRFSLPTGAPAVSDVSLGSVMGIDTGSTIWTGVSQTSGGLVFSYSNNTGAAWGNTVPFTWGNTDSLDIQISYESSTATG